MKKYALACFLVLIGISGLAVGQTPAEKDAADDIVYFKIRRIDLLFNLLPVLYSKDQINQLLPAIETSRAAVRNIRDMEYKEYGSVDKECDKAISDAVTQLILPTTAERTDLAKLLATMKARDLSVKLQNIERVTAIFDKVMTPAQRKIAANSLDMKLYVPDSKPEEIKQDQKEFIYVREILLDPLAYDLLVEMAKHMK